MLRLEQPIITTGGLIKVPGIPEKRIHTLSQAERFFLNQNNLRALAELVISNSDDFSQSFVHESTKTGLGGHTMLAIGGEYVNAWMSDAETHDKYIERRLALPKVIKGSGKSGEATALFSVPVTGDYAFDNRRPATAVIVAGGHRSAYSSGFPDGLVPRQDARRYPFPEARNRRGRIVNKPEALYLAMGAISGWSEIGIDWVQDEDIAA